MLAEKTIFKCDMKVVKSSDYPENHLKESVVQLINSGTHFSEAIENADGVPFQLIFGPTIDEGYYYNVGAGIKQLLGLDPGGLTEKVFHDMIDEIVPLYNHIPVNLVEARKKFINGEIKKYKAEVLITTPAGEKKWLMDSSLPLIDEETGKVIGSYGILFDITGLKLNNAKLALSTKQSDEDDSLRNAFLHNISHEVRTPLNAIVGFSTLLCESEFLHEQKKQYLSIINSSTDHLLEILDNIVEISKIDAGAVTNYKEELNLNSLIREVFDRFNPKAKEKGIVLHYEAQTEDGEVIVVTDKFKLEYILNNLVNNALKFTFAGTVIFGFTGVDKNIKFYVSDTGIGIPEEHKSKIFNRFYQAECGTTRRFEGTGLGLSVARAYVELLGGKIWFNSQIGKGTKFWFTVPFVK